MTRDVMTELSRSAEGVSYSGHDLEALFDLDNYQRWITDCFAPHLGGHVVEFGAGIGAMSRHLLPRVDRLDAVEPSANLVPALEARLADDARARVFAATLESYIANCPPAARDSCVLVNLLEHIEDDGAAIAALAGVLRPGGHLLVFVPAMPFLYSRLDTLLGHHRRYTRAALARLVAGAGMDIVRLRYFDMLGVLPWWLVNTIGGKDHFDPRMARLYDRIGVPLTRAIEAILPPPFGKNLLLVARRP